MTDQDRYSMPDAYPINSFQYNLVDRMFGFTYSFNTGICIKAA
jgi:hypothetical protein